MSDGGGFSGSAPVCNFIRKPPKNIRKRPAASAGSDDEEGGEDDSGAIAAARSKKPPSTTSKLFFSSANNSSEPRRFQFESSRTIQSSTDNRATATLETETAYDRDARAIRERQLKQAEASVKNDPSASGSSSGDVYKGINGYTDHKAGFRRENTVSGEKAAGAHGPLRAPAYIRISTQIDYQPGICKDYKQTGYCGYGDACKFMHDRGDYKSGWQLEREFDEAAKVRKLNE
jgi:RING finger protein 113A